VKTAKMHFSFKKHIIRHSLLQKQTQTQTQKQKKKHKMLDSRKGLAIAMIFSQF
jgi:hypothetical protein